MEETKGRMEAMEMMEAMEDEMSFKGKVLYILTGVSEERWDNIERILRNGEIPENEYFKKLSETIDNSDEADVWDAGLLAMKMLRDYAVLELEARGMKCLTKFRYVKPFLKESAGFVGNKGFRIWTREKYALLNEKGEEVDSVSLLIKSFFINEKGNKREILAKEAVDELGSLPDVVRENATVREFMKRLMGMENAAESYFYKGLYRMLTNVLKDLTKECEKVEKRNKRRKKR